MESGSELSKTVSDVNSKDLILLEKKKIVRVLGGKLRGKKRRLCGKLQDCTIV